MEHESTRTERDLKTVQQFCDKYPFMTEGGLRWQIFNAKTNGLNEAKAIVRPGRRVLIDVPRYFDWIDD